MHAFHLPAWVYLLFIVSAALLLAGLAGVWLAIRRRERLTWKGDAVIVALVVLGALGCTFLGGVVWLFGGLR